MNQRYPRAVDLAQMAHCSVCGESNPDTLDDGGDTACCGRRECNGMGPEAQDVCCQALQDRVDHEAVYGTPASPVGLLPTPKPEVKPRRGQSTRIDETRDLQRVNGDANLVSHEGGAAPTTTDTKEPEMALPPADDAQEGETFKPEPAPADEAPAASGWGDGGRYMGYDVLAAEKGRAWHVGPRNDEAVCNAKVDRRISLEDAVAMPLGICAKCSRYVDKHGAYVPYAERVAAVPAPAPAVPAPARKGAREALGASSAIGWDLLYDKPKAGAEVGRRYVAGKPEFALICKAHGHAHRLARLSDEGGVRKAGGWCPTCSK